jgi:hypothetical protein
LLSVCVDTQREIEMENIEDFFEIEFNGMQNIEVLLFKLRERGLSQIQTLALLKKKTGLSLKELDLMVLNSAVWKDNKEANISLRNTFFDKIEGE